MIFLHIFLPILYNIRSYTYTVRYISGIKYLVFSKRIQKKNLKTFNLISLLKKKKKKIFCFYTYGQILKFSNYIFLKRQKKCIFLMFLKI
jgi:hypothetical protein